MEFQHISVLLNETVDSLSVHPGGVYVDGTLGGGGHSLEIAKRLGGEGTLIGIDRDEAAVSAAGARLSQFGETVRIVRGNYSSMPEIVKDLGYAKVDGIVLDLGVSSYQL
ncbi:MAG: 16S rRNA (cytosine(1402)-N(4))-methyltransferase, partial [Lachnospiraceae bacterium]|nr:16S rRNA (cytosine(1402)-N(4))-methyltransferase [Lachnospiraceae bacterium]